jgi:ubiquinone/menaquinone biosynthesis C-methylase UbiE
MRENRLSRKEARRDPGAPRSKRVPGTHGSQGVELADVFKQALGNISGGRVLDVATGEGGFVGLLARELEHYTAIVGIDLSQCAVETAQRSFDQANIRFAQMDAECLAFRNESFDTVNISASLHHLANVPRVLAEMKRVLKRGGHLILSEMHRDGQAEPQRTAVYIHHWAAEVDTALGASHDKTFARQQIIDWAKNMGLCDIVCYDFYDVDSDPMDEAFIHQVERYMERFICRGAGLSSHKALQQRGEELRQRLYHVGVQREPVLIIVGTKP